MNKKANLITNGALINDEWAEYLLRGSQWIEISVNAVTEKIYEVVNGVPLFSKVIYNIKKLAGLKNKYGLDTLIRYHFSAVPENVHEIAAAIPFAERLGCDIITFGYDFSVPSYLKKNNEIKQKIKTEISRLINSGSLRIKIRGNRLEQLGIIENTDNDNILDNFP